MVQCPLPSTLVKDAAGSVHCLSLWITVCRYAMPRVITRYHVNMTRNITPRQTRSISHNDGQRCRCAELPLLNYTIAADDVIDGCRISPPRTSPSATTTETWKRTNLLADSISKPLWNGKGWGRCPYQHCRHRLHCTRGVCVTESRAKAVLTVRPTIDDWVRLNVPPNTL